jgi:hypothetical protein
MKPGPPRPRLMRLHLQSAAAGLELIPENGGGAGIRFWKQKM